ncbi:hypothetical protein [Streptomyces bluensis]|uniref:hypothetical protein n=1 Tax=Streptomyces bluensis TaxID=33897 RepID=UPI00332FBE24
MTRLNRPDSLLTELRDIKRRLHALETAQRNASATGTTPAAQSLSDAADDSDAPDAPPDGVAPR